MAISVARVHLKVAHAALPALLPTPPKWNMLPCPCIAAILQKLPAAAKPTTSRADADARWDAHKTKSASTESSAASSSLRSTCAAADSVWKAPPPLPKPGRADSVERWDAHKKAAMIPASSSLSPSGAPSSSVTSSTCPISRASSAERWDVHKKRCLTQAEPLDDGESSSTGSSDMDTEEEEEEEIVWKPRAMYAGPGFASATPEPSMLPMPTSFLVPVV